jgi:DNA-binding MarR family transcriptional regulator
MIRREPDPHDNRSKAVALTTAGKRLVEEILPEHWGNEGRLLAGLASEERAQLASLLERLAASLGDVPKARPRART